MIHLFLSALRMEKAVDLFAPQSLPPALSRHASPLVFGLGAAHVASQERSTPRIDDPWCDIEDHVQTQRHSETVPHKNLALAKCFSIEFPVARKRPAKLINRGIH